MKGRELASLLLAAFALAAFLVQVTGAVAQFLPGGGAELEWLFGSLGLGKPPEVYSNPAFGLAAVLTCFTPFALLMGAVSFLLWRSAAADRRRDAERLRHGADWSTTALLQGMEKLLEGATAGEVGWRARLAEAQVAVQAHLAAPHRRFFERFLERVASSSTTPALPDASETAVRRWPRVAFNVLLVIALAQIGLAAIMGVAFSAFETFPIVGMPLGPAAVFQVVATWLSFAAVSTLLAFSIRRLGRSIAAVEAETERDLEATAERLSAGLLQILKRAMPATGSEPHRVASLLVSALLETTSLRRRAAFLASLYDEGFLRAPAALDLRGCRLGAIDLEGVAWPGVVLAGANLNGARLANATLKGADLSGSRLRAAFLQGAGCARARLRGGDLAGASAQRVDFREADLSGADLTGALLWGADLTGADLTEARVDSQQLASASRSAAVVPGIAGSPA